METWFLCFNKKQVVAIVLKRASEARKLDKIARNLVFSSVQSASGIWVAIHQARASVDSPFSIYFINKSGRLNQILEFWDRHS